jgi:hypothetical protein
VALAVICVVIAAASFAGKASADPGDITITVYNCTGPAGTPATFTVEKESGHAAALHIVGTTQTFLRLGEYDLNLGQQIFGPPNGIADSDMLVTCELLNPFTNHLVLIQGFITPAS